MNWKRSLPEWLETEAFQNHRDSVEYTYENGWITGLVAALEPFFQTWAYNQLTEHTDVETVDTGRGYTAPQINGETINFNDYYQELTRRTDLNQEYLENIDARPETVLEEIQTLRNAALHGTGYYETPPLNQGGFNSYSNHVEFETTPDEAIQLYEEIMGIPETESITNLEQGDIENRFYPGDENLSEFYDNTNLDHPLQMLETHSTAPGGIDHLNSIAAAMYHEAGPETGEIGRRGYTTNYNPAQPLSALLMYNWFENTVPEMIRQSYEGQDLDTSNLPVETPETYNHVSVSDWVNHDVLEDLNLMPRSAYPNALENPVERLHELEDLRNSLAHDVNTYSNINDLEVRNIIWHGYEIMHELSDRTGYKSSEIELFGEEKERQRESIPFMTKAELLSRW